MSYPGDARLCPECSEKLNPDARACACGWRATRAPSGKSATPVYDSRCQWNDHGYRCNEIGCSSPTTGGGDWYCRKHIAALRGRPDLAKNETANNYRERWYASKRLPYEDPKPGLSVPTPRKAAA